MNHISRLRDLYMRWSFIFWEVRMYSSIILSWFLAIVQLPNHQVVDLKLKLHDYFNVLLFLFSGFYFCLVLYPLTSVYRLSFFLSRPFFDKISSSHTNFSTSLWKSKYYNRLFKLFHKLRLVVNYTTSIDLKMLVKVRHHIEL